MGKTYRVAGKFKHEAGPALHLEAEDGAIKLVVPLDVWRGAEVGASVELPEDLGSPPAVGAYFKIEF